VVCTQWFLVGHHFTFLISFVVCFASNASGSNGHHHLPVNPGTGSSNTLRLFYLLQRKPMAKGSVSDERFQPDR
jgi:hypothetical protein